MAAELQQALLETGGRTSLCTHCRPSIEGFQAHPILGLQEKINLNNNPLPRNIVRNNLKDIISASNSKTCWVCSWLLLLYQTRRLQYSSSSSLVVSVLESECKDHEHEQHEQHEWVYMGIERHLIHTFEKGRTSSDVFHDKWVLVRLDVYIDARGIAGIRNEKIDNFLYLQQSSPHPAHVGDLLDRTTTALEWEWQMHKHKPFEARIRPPEADLRLCRRWKDWCCRRHGGVCDKPVEISISMSMSSIPSIRVVDVNRRCIVHLPTTVPWVALSYCWGGPQEHALRKDNIALYATPGALTEEKVPPVLFDAMLVTEALGERYIWIDSLCIIQDDEVDKATYLAAMDAIYARAILTIINAASGDTSSGLPGIRKPIRRRTQRPFELMDGVWVTDALDPPNYVPDAGYLENCIWSTRGWTFQEGLLSRRCLVFAAEQIYWQCQRATWCEGSFWEQEHEEEHERKQEQQAGDDELQQQQLQIYRHFHGVNLFASFTSPVVDDWTPLYIAVVRDYLKRHFTAESDVMHALAGVLRLLKQVTGQEHFWGLPVNFLESALGWSSWDFPSRRESFHTYLAADDGGLRSCPFPSWSWIGWRTKAIEILSSTNTTGTGTLGLHFYRLDDKGNPTPLSQTRSLPSTSNTTHPHPWLDTTRQTITQSEIPTSLSSSPLAPSILCFWTSVATLHIEQRGWDGYWNEPRIVLTAPAPDPDPNPDLNPDKHGHGHSPVELSGRWASDGFEKRSELAERAERDQERMRDGNLNFNLPEYGTFVVVSSARQRMSHGGAMTLTLVMVEGMERDYGEDAEAEGTQGSVVGRRKHLIKEVMESQWERLQGARRWEMVFLF